MSQREQRSCKIRTTSLQLCLCFCLALLLGQLVCAEGLSCALAYAQPEREWELVSPADKGAALISPIENAVVQASTKGNAVTYTSNAPIGNEAEGNPSISQLVSTRQGPGSWSSDDISSPNAKAVGTKTGAGGEYKFFTPELTIGILEPSGNTPLAPGVSEPTIYRHPLHGGYEPLVTAANTFGGVSFGGEINFVGATTNALDVVLGSEVPLTEEAGGESEGLYEWTDEKLELVSLLPDGSPAPSPKLGNSSLDVRNAISTNGNAVIWETNAASESHLYLRDTERHETIELDESEGSFSEHAYLLPAQYQTANVEGTKIFFTDEQDLTANATTEYGEPDLYEFEVTSRQGEKPAGRLIDLTSDANPGEHADVQGMVIGASEDGSYVYFVANGVLAPHATHGECAEIGAPASATCNLYVRHNGITSYIATLSDADGPDWGSAALHTNLGDLTARVSPNGRYLAFMSSRPLTGYDNTDTHTGSPDEEVYLYSASTGDLSCVSCQNVPPSGIYDSGKVGESLLVDRPGVWAEHDLAGSLPGWTPVDSKHALYQSRYLSDSGRLYFMSPLPLIQEATNGVEDVYQYEPEGVPGGQNRCSQTSAAYSKVADGCITLISSGSSSEESAFLDASESGGETPSGGDANEGGGDSFFITAARLEPARDTDSSFDVYDAHECTHESPCQESTSIASGQCEEAFCRTSSPPQPDMLSAPSSATFSGAGDIALVTPTTTKSGSKPLSREKKLANALRACHKDRSKSRRKGCEVAAKRRYGTKARQKRKLNLGAKK